MAKIKVLVIDDEKLIGWSFKQEFENEDFSIAIAHSGEEGIRLFEKEQHDIVFLDNKLPGKNGLEVIKSLKEIRSDVQIIFMTAYGSIETAVKAIKEGATEFINKPFDLEEVRLLLHSIREKLRLMDEVALLKRETHHEKTFASIIGKSPRMQQIIELSKQIARSEARTVLLLGESGTGKDIFAAAIHNESNRKNKPFVAINCAALPETLLESELFGHEKGAFTGAHKLKKGLLEIADGGTVFLNEIGEISANIQTKLLSFLEYQTFRRVGGNENIMVDVRIIAATNKDLEAEVKNNRFRLDLLYRLNVFQIQLPPLRERKDDIPVLIDYFINLLAKRFGKPIKGITQDCLQVLQSYDWPGNVRELINVIERAVILEKGTLISRDVLPLEFVPKTQTTASPNKMFDIPERGFSLDQWEKEIIRAALNKAQNNKTRAARLLGISRDKLRYKIKKHQLE